MEITIGVDVGNYDTKTKHTSTVSGYTSYSNEQYLSDKVLKYNGLFYVESVDKRFPFIEDKTANNQCIVLSLFAISKEILWRLKNKNVKPGSMQEEISKIESINLAIGLPPGHFNKLAVKTKDYYAKAMANGVEYNYAGYNFSFKLNYIDVYAQDLTAVIMNNSLSITDREKGSPKYYICGIGGGTVDIIPINNKMPEVDDCRSLALGTRPMFESIIAKIQSSHGITLNETVIEDVLRGRRNYLKKDVIDDIFEYTRNWASQLVDRCIQSGCDFSIYPVVFVGGGGLLLKEYLKDNSLICFSEFVEDVRANASNYEDFLKLKNKIA